MRWKNSRTATSSMLLNQFETLNTEFFEKKGIHAEVLQKLNSINKGAVYRWIDQYKDLLEKKFSYALELKIDALYENRDAIPMNELASELEKIFNQNQ